MGTAPKNLKSIHPGPFCTLRLEGGTTLAVIALFVQPPKVFGNRGHESGYFIDTLQRLLTTVVDTVIFCF